MIIRRKYDNDNDDAFGTHDGNDDIFFILIAKKDNVASMRNK